MRRITVTGKTCNHFSLFYVAFSVLCWYILCVQVGIRNIAWEYFTRSWYLCACLSQWCILTIIKKQKKNIKCFYQQYGSDLQNSCGGNKTGQTSRVVALTLVTHHVVLGLWSIGSSFRCRQRSLCPRKKKTNVSVSYWIWNPQKIRTYLESWVKARNPQVEGRRKGTMINHFACIQ